MLKTDRDKLIREFYVYLNPPEDYDTFSHICKTPFYSLKRTIQTGNLFEIRFLRFGKFTIHGSIIVGLLKHNQKQYEKGFMKQEDYEAFIKSFNSLYQRHPEKFKKYEESKVLEQWKYL